jgi:hypothetical protein
MPLLNVRHKMIVLRKFDMMLKDRTDLLEVTMRVIYGTTRDSSRFDGALWPAITIPEVVVSVWVDWERTDTGKQMEMMDREVS